MILYHTVTSNPFISSLYKPSVTIGVLKKYFFLKAIETCFTSEESSDPANSHDPVLDSLPSTSANFGKLWPNGSDKRRSISSRSKFFVIIEGK